jgi:hypothetical protein
VVRREYRFDIFAHYSERIAKRSFSVKSEMPEECSSVAFLGENSRRNPASVPPKGGAFASRCGTAADRVLHEWIEVFAPHEGGVKGLYAGFADFVREIPRKCLYFRLILGKLRSASRELVFFHP